MGVGEGPVWEGGEWMVIECLVRKASISDEDGEDELPLLV